MNISNEKVQINLTDVPNSSGYSLGMGRGLNTHKTSKKGGCTC